MRRLIAAGATDVGRVRTTNEDALLLRDSVFAVADGMGGHLAGEVASAKALEPISELEGRVFKDAPQAVTALREAIVAANATVSELAQTEPSYRGMGTTLTAALVEGRRLHVAHVGDSRAYLLRNGQFSQLTDDHTLVQHLVDEGQITREEAANHPQRSMITRAIGISPDIDVDSMTLDLEPGDQLLLCSDGLTGVIEDEVIAQELLAGHDTQTTVDRLISRANRAGGPDNVTVVVLRYEDLNGDTVTATPHPTIAIRSSTEPSNGEDWAGRLGSYGGSLLRSSDGSRPREDPDTRHAGRILGRASAIALAIFVVAGLAIGGATFLLSQSYYVGLDDAEVVIYQGIAAEVGPISLSRVVERSPFTIDDVPEYFQPSLEAGLPAADLSDARRRMDGVPRRETSEDDTTSTDGAGPEPGADDDGTDTGTGEQIAAARGTGTGDGAAP